LPNTKAECGRNYIRSTVVSAFFDQRLDGAVVRKSTKDHRKGLQAVSGLEFEVKLEVERLQEGREAVQFWRAFIGRSTTRTYRRDSNVSQRTKDIIGSLNRGCVPEVSCSEAEKSRAYVSGKSSHHWRTGSIPPELVSQNQLTY
jgi:hypothetical protein